MTTAIAVLAGVAVILVLFLVAYGKGQSAGKTSARADQQGKVIDNVDKAKDAADRVLHPDGDADQQRSDRLSGRFTRK